MSQFMEIHAALPLEQVVNHLQRGRLGPFAFGPLIARAGNRWGGTWERGVLSVRALDEEDRQELHERFHLPKTLRSCIWITTPDIHADEEAAHHMMAIALREWEGDMVLLNGGDELEVQRINGKIQVRSDYLSPGSLAAYADVSWQSLR